MIKLCEHFNAESRDEIKRRILTSVLDLCQFVSLSFPCYCIIRVYIKQSRLDPQLLKLILDF